MFSNKIKLSTEVAERLCKEIEPLEADTQVNAKENPIPYGAMTFAQLIRFLRNLPDVAYQKCLADSYVMLLEKDKMKVDICIRYIPFMEDSERLINDVAPKTIIMGLCEIRYFEFEELFFRGNSLNTIPKELLEQFEAQDGYFQTENLNNAILFEYEEMICLGVLDDIQMKLPVISFLLGKQTQYFSKILNYAEFQGLSSIRTLKGHKHVVLKFEVFLWKLLMRQVANLMDCPCVLKLKVDFGETVVL